MVMVCGNTPHVWMPDSMTVQKVKGLLHRMLKVTGCELRLTYTSSKVNPQGTQNVRLSH